MKHLPEASRHFRSGVSTYLPAGIEAPSRATILAEFVVRIQLDPRDIRELSSNRSQPSPPPCRRLPYLLQMHQSLHPGHPPRHDQAPVLLFSAGTRV
jgi:hypothetical protein